MPQRQSTIHEDVITVASVEPAEARTTNNATPSFWRGVSRAFEEQVEAVVTDISKAGLALTETQIKIVAGVGAAACAAAVASAVSTCFGTHASRTSAKASTSSAKTVADQFEWDKDQAVKKKPKVSKPRVLKAKKLGKSRKPPPPSGDWEDSDAPDDGGNDGPGPSLPDHLVKYPQSTKKIMHRVVESSGETQYVTSHKNNEIFESAAHSNGRSRPGLRSQEAGPSNWTSSSRTQRLFTMLDDLDLAQIEKVELAFQAIAVVPSGLQQSTNDTSGHLDGHDDLGKGKAVNRSPPSSDDVPVHPDADLSKRVFCGIAV